MTLSVPFQIDDDGYFDRQCPWSECGFTFKVLFEDWGEKFLMSGHTTLSAATRRSRPNSIHLSKLNI